ncbi:MAG: dTMP kinase [Chloroflexi bacterium]|nr:dTMP kinase [Chloroflexota bacterium]
MATSQAGIFITFEGIEGCGKTTQSDMLYNYLIGQGYPAMFTREPGGTPVGEAVRKILADTKHKDMLPITETLLFSAARYQHVNQVIRPSLEEGMIIISDRFADATVAYQGFGRKVPMDLIRELNQVATWGVWPNLTVLLDIDPVLAFERLRGRLEQTSQDLDRIEQETVEFFRNVREGYLQLATDDPARIKTVEAAGDPDEVHQRILDLIRPHLRAYGRPQKINL